jgi:hypothetical protein
MLVGTSGMWSLLSGQLTPTLVTQVPPAGHCSRVQLYHFR